MARSDLVATLVTKGVDALLRHDVADARRIATILRERQHQPVKGLLLAAGATFARRLPASPRALRLTTDLMTRRSPTRGAVVRLCTHPSVVAAIDAVARTSGHVAILGASRHTQWLLAATALRRAPLRAVLVLDPPPVPRFCDLPVHPLRDASALGLSTLVVAIPEPSPTVRAQLASLAATGVSILQPFSPLPAELVPRPPTGRLVPSTTPEHSGTTTLVAYLARKAEQLAPFERFLDSYLANLPRRAHELLIIYKGFAGEHEVAPYRERLARVRHHHTFVSEDIGLDLGAYFEVFRRFRHPRYLFLGSHCELRDAGWLTHFEDALAAPSQPTIVGASASWASGITPVFPNPHVRTSAFLVNHELLAQLRVAPIRAKDDAYAVEHGLHSITRQALAFGGRASVVGLDGRAYGPEEFASSHTYAAGDQHNLLVSDNRTRLYQDADRDTRRILAEDVWGVFGPPDVAG